MNDPGTPKADHLHIYNSLLKRPYCWCTWSASALRRFMAALDDVIYSVYLGALRIARGIQKN